MRLPADKSGFVGIKPDANLSNSMAIFEATYVAVPKYSGKRSSKSRIDYIISRDTAATFGYMIISAIEKVGYMLHMTFRD